MNILFLDDDIISKINFKEFEYYNFRKDRFFDEKDKFNKAKMENVDGK